MAPAATVGIPHHFVAVSEQADVGAVVHQRIGFEAHRAGLFDHGHRLAGGEVHPHESGGLGIGGCNRHEGLAARGAPAEHAGVQEAVHLVTLGQCNGYAGAGFHIDGKEFDAKRFGIAGDRHAQVVHGGPSRPVRRHPLDERHGRQAPFVDARGDQVAAVGREGRHVRRQWPARFPARYGDQRGVGPLSVGPSGQAVGGQPAFVAGLDVQDVEIVLLRENLVAAVRRDQPVGLHGGGRRGVARHGLQGAGHRLRFSADPHVGPQARQVIGQNQGTQWEARCVQGFVQAERRADGGRRGIVIESPGLLPGRGIEDDVLMARLGIPPIPEAARIP